MTWSKLMNRKNNAGHLMSSTTHIFTLLSWLTIIWSLLLCSQSWNVWPVMWLPYTPLSLGSLWCESYTLHLWVVMHSFSSDCQVIALTEGFWILRTAPWIILLFITIYTTNSRSYHQADCGARLWIKGYIFYQFQED